VKELSQPSTIDAAERRCSWWTAVNEIGHLRLGPPALAAAITNLTAVVTGREVADVKITLIVLSKERW